MRNRSRVVPTFRGKPQDLQATSEEKKKVKNSQGRHIAKGGGYRNSIQARLVVLAFPRLSPRPLPIFILQCLAAAILTSLFSPCHRLTGIRGFSWLRIIISNRIYDTFAADLALRKPPQKRTREALCRARYRFSCGV